MVRAELDELLLSACSDVHSDVVISRLHLYAHFFSTNEVMRSIKFVCVRVYVCGGYKIPNI